MLVSFLQLAFRPFFLAATILSIVSMILWFLMLNYDLNNNYMQNTYWHAHEMIFGYTMAIIVGFLLTAIRNWTKLPTLSGIPLLIIFILWIIARFMPFLSNNLLLQSIVDASFLVIVTIFITYLIIKAKNWINIPIIAKLCAFSFAHILFYLGLLGFVEGGETIGLYLGFYLVISLIFMMIRRLIPFFIQNGIDGEVEIKNSKFLDIASMVLFIIFIVTTIVDKNSISVVLAGVLFIIHTIRLFNWYHHNIWKKPLLWSLYSAYIFLNFGFLLIVVDYIMPLPINIATHSFAFGIALVTLGMISRVSLGHTSRDINKHSKFLNIMFIFLIIAFIFRVIMVIILPHYYVEFILLSQVFWIVGFIIFVIIYTPILLSKNIPQLKYENSTRVNSNN